MHLNDLVESYIAERDLSQQYQAQLRHRIGDLVRFLGGDRPPSELTAGVINAWLIAVQDSGRSPQTILGYRRAILSIVRHGADLGLCCDMPSRRVRLPKVVRKPPQAWSVEEVRRLLGAAKDAYWQLYVRVGYETGLRRSDILSLPAVYPYPWVVVQAKTGTGRLVIVTAETASLWHEVGSLSWAKCRREWFVAADRIIYAAGLRGTMKWLRRSHGSYVGSLGHASPEVFRRHYLDPRLGGDPPLPPSL